MLRGRPLREVEEQILVWQPNLVYICGGNGRPAVTGSVPPLSWRTSELEGEATKKLKLSDPCSVTHHRVLSLHSTGSGRSLSTTAPASSCKCKEESSGCNLPQFRQEGFVGFQAVALAKTNCQNCFKARSLTLFTWTLQGVPNKVQALFASNPEVGLCTPQQHSQLICTPGRRALVSPSMLAPPHMMHIACWQASPCLQERLASKVNQAFCDANKIRTALKMTLATMTRANY